MESKVAIIDPVGQKAGMDFYDEELLTALSERGVKSYVFSNFVCANKNIISYPFFDGFQSSKWIKAYSQIIAHFKSYLVCKKSKIEILIFHVFSVSVFKFLMILGAKLLKLKIVVIAHDPVSLTGEDSHFLQKWLYNKICDNIVVHNQYSYDKLLHLVDKKIELNIIKHGGFIRLYDDQITKSDARKTLDLDSSKKYLLFFGQIKSSKRLDVILRAMPHIADDVHLVIAGKPYKDDFEKYLNIIKEQQLENRVVLKLGFVSNQERSLLMKACDVMVLPYQEIFQSGVLLMAMSFKMVVVCSDIESFKEIIKDGVNGSLFKSLSSENLSFKINSIIHDNKRLEQIKTEAYSTIKNDFSWDKIALDYKKMLKL